jgi:hypothetical protein
MVNMARIASMNLRKGEAEVQRGAQQYFNAMGRSTRTIARLQLAPEVLERLTPPLRAPDEYERTPGIVFYTGCNVIKTPHIALLVFEVLDALDASYEVMGGTATCCGIQQFKRGDAKTAGRNPTWRHGRLVGGSGHGLVPSARRRRRRRLFSATQPSRRRQAARRRAMRSNRHSP